MRNRIGDVRPSILLTLWLARCDGEIGLDRTMIIKRVRTSDWSERVINSAIDDLDTAGFVARSGDSPAAYSLTPMSEGWIEANYYLEKSHETRRFNWKAGGADLPEPSKDYEKRLPERIGRRFWLRMAFMLVVLAVAQFLMRRL